MLFNKWNTFVSLTYLHFFDCWHYIKNLDKYPLNIYGSKAIFFLKKFFSDVGHFKVFIESVAYYFCFMFWFFICKRDLGFLTRVETVPSVMESKVVTSGPPGNFCYFYIIVWVDAQSGIIDQRACKCQGLWYYCMSFY